MNWRFICIIIASTLLGLLSFATYNVIQPGLSEPIDIVSDKVTITDIDWKLTQEQEVSVDIADSLRASYEPLTPFTFGIKSMYASVANTDVLRTKGLSGTPSLPADIAKVFVFESSSKYGFWMKDMNYPIDIVWVDETGEVVHIESNVSPDTYPKSFAPTKPARVVIEVVAGVASLAEVKVGDRIDVDAFLAE